jgi:hypothetical protein
MTTYKGYEVHRNRLTGMFYALRLDGDTFLSKITSPTREGLKQAIDEATATQRLDPWELPYQTAQTIAA